MAVDITLTPIGSGFNRTLINTNFQRIDTALQDALSRSGTSPNSMSVDIDMDGNDLLNVGSLGVESITIDGTEFLADEITAKGDPGTAATIEVGTVTTGAAGTDVIVTNVGDETNAVFDITIPRGDVGASGSGSGDMVAAQNLSDVADAATSFANIKQAATESATGVVELSTNAEAITGTDTTRAITPANLKAAKAPRVNTITSSATPTTNTDNYDFVDITALATAITSMTTNLSGTPTVGQVLVFQIKDNGTARAITWGASFTAKGVALPTTTVISKLLTVGFIWNGSNWGCVGSAQEI